MSCDPVKILCFGDSNTFGYDPRSFFGSRYEANHRWVDIVQDSTGFTMINAGQNGREIPRRNFEFQAIQDLLRQHNPHGILVMLGTNDLLQGADLDTVTARMEAFLQVLPLPVLLIAPPTLQRGAWVETDSPVAASRLLGEHYRGIADRLQIPFADSGMWEIELTFDGVHFSESGHCTFADHLTQLLRGEPIWGTSR